MIKPSPFSTPLPWELVSEGYEETTRLFLEKYSFDALTLVAPSSTAKVLDVACGPGTMAFLVAKKVDSVTAVDFSKAMIEIVNRKIKENNIKNLETLVADGQQLFFANDSFDNVFSMFGLMFFPDSQKGINEIYRVLKPGGKIAISSWAPIDQSPAMQLMFDAVRVADPSTPKPEKVIDSFENKDHLINKLKNAGFKDVVVHKSTQGIEGHSVQEFWNFMKRGSAPLVMMKHNMPEEKWNESEKKIIDYLSKKIISFPLYLTSDAWIGIGVK